MRNENLSLQEREFSEEMFKNDIREIIERIREGDRSSTRNLEIAKEIEFRIMRIAWETGDPDIDKIISQVRYYVSKTGDAEAVKLATEVIRIYIDVPKVAREIAWEIIYIAQKTENAKIVKNFVDLVKNKKIERYIVKLPYDIIIEISTQYYDLVKSEEIRGVKKVEIGKILDINPRDKDFWNKVRKVTKRRFGVDLSSLSVNELRYTVESFEKLSEGYPSFKKLLELLIENKYWEDEEIKKVLNEMKKYGINVKKLRGRF